MFSWHIVEWIAPKYYHNFISQHIIWLPNCVTYVHVTRRMNFYLPYVAVLWLTVINIDYVDASLDPSDLAAIVADDEEASGCTEDARGACVDQFTDGNQDVCSSLMTFYNCALTSVLTTPECAANAVVTEYVQTIEKLRIYSAHECASENECDSVFQNCFVEHEWQFNELFGTGEVDVVQQLTYSVYLCYELRAVVHCLHLQQDTGCYPWLSDDTFAEIKETIFTRCPNALGLYEYHSSELWINQLDDSQDFPDDCMSHVNSCEVTLFRTDVFSETDDYVMLCSAFMTNYGCILKDVRSFSTSCATNPAVEKYIDYNQKIRLFTASMCPNVTECNREPYDTCMGDQLAVVKELNFENIEYTNDICSAFRRSVYCLDTMSSGCTNDWLPSSAVRQMSADLTDASCAMNDLPPSLRSSPATILTSTRMLAIVTIILCFIL